MFVSEDALFLTFFLVDFFYLAQARRQVGELHFGFFLTARGFSLLLLHHCLLLLLLGLVFLVLPKLVFDQFHALGIGAEHVRAKCKGVMV